MCVQIETAIKIYSICSFSLKRFPQHKKNTRFDIDYHEQDMNRVADNNQSLLTPDCMETGKLLAFLNVGFAVVNLDGILTFVNKVGEELLELNFPLPVESSLFEFGALIPATLSIAILESMHQQSPHKGQYYFAGQKRWLEVDIQPVETGLHLFFRDITDKTLLHELDILEKKVLEMHLNDHLPLTQLITMLLNGIKRIHPTMLCSVLKEKDGHLHTWSSPHLPAGYNELVNGIAIGPQCGSCGTAAYLKQKVIVTDTLEDDRWERYRDIAVRYQLRSCISQPIFAAGGQLLGTVAVYSKTAGMPNPHELRTIDRVRVVLETIIQQSFAKQTILRSESSLRDAQSIAHVGSWYIDFSDNHIWWSDEMYQILGFTDHEVEPNLESLLSMVHPQDREIVGGLLSSKVSMRRKLAHQYRIIRKNGEVRYVYAEWRYEFGPSGEATRITGIIQDVTAITVTTSALKKSELEYRALFESSPVPLWVYDVHTLKFINVNKAAIHLYGYSREEFLRMTVLDIQPEEERHLMDAKLRQIHVYGKPGGGRCRHLKSNGEVMDMSVQAIKIHVDGRPARLVQAIDVTDTLKHQQAIEKQNEQLREIAWLQSHIVRTPVCQILSIIELLNTEGVHDEERLQLFNYLKQSAQKLDEIICSIVEKTVAVRG